MVRDAIHIDTTDTIVGSSGDDVLAGGNGNDIIKGLGGDDILSGGLGFNALYGGAGVDTVTYADFTLGGVTVDLVNGWGGINSEGPPIDSLYSIENVVGSDYGDQIYGDGRNNRLEGGLGGDFISSGGGRDFLFGGQGDDTLSGGDGVDVLDGGDGSDTAGFETASSGVTVDLAQGGWVHTDQGKVKLISIENLFGTQFADSLTGDDGDNTIHGGTGLAADTLNGAGGDDTIYSAGGMVDGGAGDDLVISPFGDGTLEGGDGVDTVSFDYPSGGYKHPKPGETIDLASGLATSPQGYGTDQLHGFENVIGSPLNDIISGDAGANSLDGARGDDTLTGSGGDTLRGGAGHDVFAFDDQANLGGTPLIADLNKADVIDLSAIDADTGTAGDQAFVLTDHFHGVAGEAVLSWDKHAHMTHLGLDTDGDGAANLVIDIAGDRTDFTAFTL